MSRRPGAASAPVLVLNRRGLLVLAATAGLPAAWRPARAGATAPAPPWLALDQVYIPALFHTGSGGRSPEAAQRAGRALARLQAQWPALRPTLLAWRPADGGWVAALRRVEGHLQQAVQDAARGDWPHSHEALEGVRDTLAQARLARGEAYLLDDYTAFHGAMEAITAQAANPAPLDRAVLRTAFTTARALWQALLQQPPEPTLWGLSPARLTQWRQGVQEESDAFTALSQALDRPAAEVPEPALRQAAAALKAPFVKAYIAFGLGLDEVPAR
ncbi:hypothetical protein [Ideonella livida]|uniref:Uncharacterized protein n=1 Tax=Ideonella livida TaxID=2707176 RepID=A0A7C9PIG1_9BURK|nr:hypothetical protein [Ideonella livida]NDY92817.1 hypothetical protein [Ideonella livida]